MLNLVYLTYSENLMSKYYNILFLNLNINYIIYKRFLAHNFEGRIFEIE